MRRGYFHQGTTGRWNHTIENGNGKWKWKKHTIILVFEKGFQQVARALVALRKRKKKHILVLAYDANFKKKQQDQGGKNWRYTKHFMSLTISNLTTTAFCFENIKLLNKFWIIFWIMNVFCDSEKKNRSYNTFSNSAK